MKNTFTAVIKNMGDWWLGWIEELPGVNCQEKNHEELMESLREALREALEFNRGDAIAAAQTGYLEETITV